MNIPLEAFIIPAIAVLAISLGISHNKLHWKKVAKENSFKLTKIFPLVKMENDKGWQCRIYRNRNYTSYHFSHDTKLPPFKAKHRGLITKWENHDGVDTNATEKKILDRLKKEALVIQSKKVSIKSKNNNITYRITQHNLIRMQGRFEEAYGLAQELHEALHSK